MSTERVNNQNSIVGQIVYNLDMKDNNHDNKISKSVWDDFWAQNDPTGKFKGRKEAAVGDNGISVDEAKKLIMTRIFNAFNRTGKTKSVNRIGADWLDNMTKTEPQRTGASEQRQVVTTPPVSTTPPAVANTSVVTNRTNLYPVDTSYSTLNRNEALVQAAGDTRLEHLTGGNGWSVATESFVTDIPYAKKNTGRILSFISSIIGENLVVTSALGTNGINGHRSPHVCNQNYSTHHNAENPKLDIRLNGHGQSLKRKLLATGFFKRVSLESDHLDIQIKPEIYAAFERGNTMNDILACAQNNTLNTLLA